MTREVFWSKTALDDLKNQVGYIATDNPLAARHIADALKRAAESLGQKSTGRPGRVSGTLEKSVPRLPYVIAYALDDAPSPARVVILRVVHTARNWAAGSWPR